MIVPRAHAWLRALLCAVLLASCKPEDDPATQIIVSVNSNLEIGGEITRVRIEVKETSGSDSSKPESFSLGTSSGRTRFPFSFGIQKGSKSRVTVIATGYGPTSDGEGVVVERKENVRFKDGETLLLKIFLNDRCLDNVCGSTETCQSTGQCAPVREASLDSINPGDEDDAWDENGGGEGGAGEGGVGGEGGAGVGGAGEGGAGIGGEAGTIPSDCNPPCVGDEECIDQTCVCSVPTTTYYFDGDDDGYGDPSRSLEGCGVVPDGHVTDSTDCCDGDDAVYPMSMEWSFLPSLCGLGDDGPSDWDFDCDGTIEGVVQLRMGDCCDYTNGWLDGWIDVVEAPFCGEQGTISICNEDTCLFEDAEVFQECW
jgi:hypothetical protein